MSELLGNLDDLLAQVRRRAEQRALVLEAGAEEQQRRIAEEGEAPECVNGSLPVWS